MATPIEARRALNIARNERLLAAAGLIDNPLLRGVTKKKRTNKRAMRKQSEVTEQQSKTSVRRSLRHRGAPSSRDLSEVNATEQGVVVRQRPKRKSPLRGKQLSRVSSSTSNSGDRATFNSSSLATVSRCFSSASDCVLGAKFDPADSPCGMSSGELKAAAMYATAGSKKVRFSRLGGLQAFADGVCLFVNVDRILENSEKLVKVQKSSADYDNVFNQDLMTWFASPSMGPQTALLRRAVGRLAPSLDDDANHPHQAAHPLEPVLLWLRFPGQPFVFSGRVEAVNVDFSVRPVAVVFRLLDYARIRQRPPAADVQYVRSSSSVECTEGVLHGADFSQSWFAELVPI